MAEVQDWVSRQEEHFLHHFGTGKAENIALFEGHLPPAGSRIIDLGTNGPYMTRALLDRGYDAYGADLPRLAEEARRRDPSVADRIFSCNLECQEVPGGPYDMVLALGVVEHLLSYKELFSKVACALKGGGALFITTCCRDTAIGEPYHHHHFVPEELEGLGRGARLTLERWWQTSNTNLLAFFRNEIRKGAT